MSLQKTLLSRFRDLKINQDRIIKLIALFLKKKLIKSCAVDTYKVIKSLVFKCQQFINDEMIY